MYKSCSKCGKVHSTDYKCTHNFTRKTTTQKQLRNKQVWHKKSEEIRSKSKYLCEVCKQEKRYTHTNLEVHHIISIKEDKDRLLDNYNLICLCQEHHKMAEAGKIDKEYLFKLAMDREDG